MLCFILTQQYNCRNNNCAVPNRYNTTTRFLLCRWVLGQLGVWGFGSGEGPRDWGKGWVPLEHTFCYHVAAITYCLCRICSFCAFCVPHRISSGWGKSSRNRKWWGEVCHGTIRRTSRGYLRPICRLGSSSLGRYSSFNVSTDFIVV